MGECSECGAHPIVHFLCCPKKQEIFLGRTKWNLWYGLKRDMVVRKHRNRYFSSTREMHEEGRRKNDLIKNRELSTLLLGVTVGNEFLLARLKLVNWLNNSNWHVKAHPYRMWRDENWRGWVNFIRRGLFASLGNQKLKCVLLCRRTMPHCFLCPFQLLWGSVPLCRYPFRDDVSRLV